MPPFREPRPTSLLRGAIGQPARSSPVSAAVSTEADVSSSRPRPGRSSRRKLARNKARKAAQAAAQAPLFESTFRSVTGLDASVPLVVHSCSRQPGLLARLREIEESNHDNLHGFVSLPELQAAAKEVPGAKLIFCDPRSHNVLMDADSKEVFGIVSYRNLDNLSKVDREEAIDAMTSLDLVLRTTNNIIKVNGASRPKGSDGAKPRPHGRMHAFGWHPSYEPGGTVTRYAAQSKSTLHTERMASLELAMKRFARFVDHRLSTLHSVASNEVNEYAAANAVPRFDLSDIKDVYDDPEAIGFNSVTVTSEGFCNVAHCDQDVSPFNFGMFWAGKASSTQFCGDLSRVSKNVHGGEFYWAEYGVVVSHASTNSWAEVIWRGDRDYHGTLSCWLDEGAKWDDYNRWGASCQITKKLLNRLLSSRRGNP